MDSVELLMEIEDYFQIAITNVDAENIETVGDFQLCILAKLRGKKSIHSSIPYYEPDDIYEILKKIISQKLGVSLARITLSASIAKDLSID